MFIIYRSILINFLKYRILILKGKGNSKKNIYLILKTI